MLDGTLQGLQVLNTPDYTMITGLIDQTKVNIQGSDAGGELDSGGQDTVRLFNCAVHATRSDGFPLTGWQPDWWSLVFQQVWCWQR
jgi:hypothetical protein